MKVEVRLAGPFPVIVPAGRVTIGPPSDAFKSALESVMDGGAPHVIVDASHVEYLDSSGIGELIAAARRLSESGGRLGICCASPKVKEILEVTGLRALFVVGDTEETVARLVVITPLAPRLPP